MRSLKEIKKRAAKAAAVAFLLLGAVGVVSYASEADTAKTPFVLTFNTSTTGVFPRGVSYEGISLEGKTLEEAKSEISDYIEDRQSRYMVWNIVGNTYEYSAFSRFTLAFDTVLDRVDVYSLIVSWRVCVSSEKRDL